MLRLALGALAVVLLLVEFWPALVGSPQQCDAGEEESSFAQVEKMIDRFFEGLERK